MAKEPTKKELAKALIEMDRAANLLFTRLAIIQPFFEVYKRNSKTMAWIANQDKRHKLKK